MYNIPLRIRLFNPDQNPDPDLHYNLSLDPKQPPSRIQFKLINIMFDAEPKNIDQNL